MTIGEMLQQSVMLTVFGMTIVFIFLWIMIVCVNLMGKLARKMGWDKEPEKPGSGGPKNTGISPGKAAAITAAITEYRAKEE